MFYFIYLYSFLIIVVIRGCSIVDKPQSDTLILYHI